MLKFRPKSKRMEMEPEQMSQQEFFIDEESEDKRKETIGNLSLLTVSLFGFLFMVQVAAIDGVSRKVFNGSTGPICCLYPALFVAESFAWELIWNDPNANFLRMNNNAWMAKVREKAPYE